MWDCVTPTSADFVKIQAKTVHTFLNQHTKNCPSCPTVIIAAKILILEKTAGIQSYE
jgi:hypothetical protein